MRQVGFPACLTRNLTTGHKRSEPNTYIQNEHKTDGDLAGQKKGLKKTAREILLPGKISHEAVRCPVEMATERYTREEITIAQTPIPRGELVMAVIGSANRDANAFDHPDLLDITRKNNKHLAFGHGAHFCLGVSLARLEGQIAISTLIQRMPNLRLSLPPDQLRWRGTFLLRGLEALPVSF